MARLKLKSHSGASKRFHKTGSGKLLRRKAGRRHILTTKDRTRKRRLKAPVEVSPTMLLNVKRLLPYS